MQGQNRRFDRALPNCSAYRLRLLAILVCLTFLSTVQALEPVPVSGDRVTLDGQIEYLLDPDSQLELAEVLSSRDWMRPQGAETLSLGFTDEAVWVHAKLEWGTQQDEGQASGRPEAWYIAVPYPLLQNVQVYVLGNVESGVETSGAEKALAASVNPERSFELAPATLESHNHVFRLPESSSGKTDLLIYAASTTALQVPLEIWSHDYFIQRQIYETLLWGLYFGTLLALFAYNLFVFYSVRDTAYAYYVFYLAAIGGLMLSISGFGRVYLWADAEQFSQTALLLFTGISSFSGLLFALRFLAWGGHAVPLRRTMIAMAVLSLGLAFYGMIAPSIAAKVSGGWSAVVLGVIISSAALALFRGVVIARYFLVAWTCFAAGASLYLLNIFGWIPVSRLSNYSLQIGSAAEVILLALALAHRIKVERQEKLNALEQQHRAEDQIKEMRLRALEQSMHDRETGMPNDSLLLMRLRELCEPEIPSQEEIEDLSESSFDTHAESSEPVHPDETGEPQYRFWLTLIYFDRLKDISATLGRKLGLDLFRDVVRHLNREFASDPHSLVIESKRGYHLAVTELGGIAVLFTGDLTESTLEAALDKHLSRYKSAITLGSLSLVLDSQCGIAHCPKDGLHAERIFQNALMARDAAFQLKRRINFYDTELDEASRRRLALLGALNRAIERGELDLYLQPQFGCQNMELVGAEILLRWHSKDYGRVAPDEFIEIAEQGGLINRLTQYVVVQSLVLLQDLKRLGIRLSLSINLSVQNLMEPRFAQFVIDAAKDHSVPLANLVLEVTETAMSQNIDLVKDSLGKLADSGAHIALDDFGTGYSSLTYLSRLPINELKIDKSFVQQMGLNENDLRIVENTIKLAHALHLETVAEGVEDQASLDVVSGLGCSRVQGYHTGKPMPAADFKAWAVKRAS